MGLFTRQLPKWAKLGNIAIVDTSRIVSVTVDDDLGNVTFHMDGAPDVTGSGIDLETLHKNLCGEL